VFDPFKDLLDPNGNESENDGRNEK
jgi:hypothetical protein